MRATAAWLLIVTAVLASGCGRTARPMPTTEAEKFDAAWAASTETLREYGFRLDRQDRYQGVITTFNETGKSWFEFWRKDSASAAGTLESSLQTIYHNVVVQFGSPDDRGFPAIDVTVHTSRSDLPAPQVTTTSGAYELFHLSEGSRRGRYRLELGKDVDLTPSPLPDDPALAEKIGRDIEARIANRLAGQPG